MHVVSAVHDGAPPHTAAATAAAAPQASCAPAPGSAPIMFCRSAAPVTSGARSARAAPPPPPMPFAAAPCPTVTNRGWEDCDLDLLCSRAEDTCEVVQKSERLLLESGAFKKVKKVMKEGSSRQQLLGSKGDCEKEAAAAGPVNDSPSPSTSDPTKMAPSGVVTLLNLTRNIDGVWGPEESLFAALACALPDPAAGAAAAQAAQPPELTPGLWVPVLALAFLRKHCAADKGAWGAMADKAMHWLEGQWPEGARPLGFVVLAAAKWV